MLQSPVQTVIAVPYLVGFVPHNSIVLVMMAPISPTATTRNSEHQIKVTMRFDLPDRVHQSKTLSALAVALSQADAGGHRFSLARVLLWSTDADLASFAGLISNLQHVLGAFDIELESCIVTDGDCWHEQVFIPFNSTLTGRLSDEPHECLDAEIAMMAAGYSHVASREQLEVAHNQITNPIAAQTLAQARRERAAAHEARQGISWRQQQEDGLVAACLGGQTVQISDDHWARWAIALADSRVREPVIHRLILPTPDNGDPHLPWLHSVRRTLHYFTCRLQGPEAAPVAATLATCAWQAGDGAAANVAAQRALAADPSNTLARIVHDAARMCVPPREWRNVLSRFELWQLRELPPPEPIAS